MSGDDVTAGLLVIGDEILSGRTKDKNIGHVAEYLTAMGIDLAEVRIVPDVEPRIIEALDALRGRYTYVFTTGGIGPTHDDITADAVAKAFGVPLVLDERAVALLRERMGAGGELNEARLRMARVPEGAELVANPVSKAPGFRIGNVIVMAGVPAIMQGMLDSVAPTLTTGARMLSVSLTAGVKEGDVAEPLRELAGRYPDVIMGSYPHFDGARFFNTLVLRSRDKVLLDEAVVQAKAMLEQVKARLAGEPS